MADAPQFADLVFEGGRVKGIGLAGAYAELARRGVQPKGVAGTSAGAITAAFRGPEERHSRRAALEAALAADRAGGTSP